MSLLNDILDWATAELTLWQRDALRRLFQKQELDLQDYDDLYAMLKSNHGVPDPQNRQPVPLTQEHLPVHLANARPVVLRALRDLKHVNRIAPGQKLEFAPTGITVVYGGTGSGKSGYARVLKRACRARDISETVHPDAFDPNATTSTPQAIFDIEIDGTPNSLAWKRDIPPPDELSTVAVFDARCARAYLDTEKEVAYQPYGLDIVENLGSGVLPVLSQRLNTEMSGIDIDTTPFADLLGDTAVGTMITSLSATTDPQKLTALATLTVEETSRLAHLDKTLAESDPKSKAKALRLSAQRIDALISRIDAAVGVINAAAVEKLKLLDNDAETAAQAEIVAAVNFRAGEQLLPGTGEPVWKNLFEEARRFSTQVAYPGKSFPNVDAGAQCLLCQQPLDKIAAERMERFENFIRQETAKVAAEKRKQRQEAVQKIERASLDFGLDAATTAELEQLDVTQLRATQDFEKKIKARKVWIMGALKAHTWDGTPAFDSDPRLGLKSLSTKLVGQAADLDKVSDEAQKKALELERNELRAQASLTPRLKAVLDLIQRMQVKAKLAKCKDDLKTKAISDKAREFSSKAVTVALRNALNAEFQALGVGYIKTKLNERVELGKMKHKLVLDLPVTKKLDEILSEGEQRAIAIGSFLAELHLAGHKGGIVFDDPVSSLDHYRRKDVARRLVAEAKVRQVIILTHDTVFLGELRDVIEQQSVNHVIHHLDWVNGYPGHVNEGLPWEHKSYVDRLDKHEKAQRLLEKTWPAYPNDEDCGKMRHEYSLLRSTIERVIQDLVFNGVVQRYRDWIRVDKLDGVVGVTNAEYKTIARLHKACCDVVDSHDPASAKNSPVPDAKQLGQDIADLNTVVDGIKSRRKEVASK